MRVSQPPLPACFCRVSWSFLATWLSLLSSSTPSTRKSQSGKIRAAFHKRARIFTHVHTRARTRTHTHTHTHTQHSTAHSHTYTYIHTHWARTLSLTHTNMTCTRTHDTRTPQRSCLTKYVGDTKELLLILLSLFLSAGPWVCSTWPPSCTQSTPPSMSSLPTSECLSPGYRGTCQFQLLVLGHLYRYKR